MCVCVSGGKEASKCLWAWRTHSVLALQVSDSPASVRQAKAATQTLVFLFKASSHHTVTPDHYYTGTAATDTSGSGSSSSSSRLGRGKTCGCVAP